jgi:hypothetical protein
MSNSQNERLIDALIRADRYQAEQMSRQLRTKQDAGFHKGDVTTNGPLPVYTQPGRATLKRKWGWI